MNILLVGMALAALPAAAELRQSPNADPITIYSSFEHAPPDALLEQLQEEVSTILEPAGIRLEWRTLGPESANHVSIELVVVTFKGACMAGPPPAHADEGPLGLTHTSDGEVLPFVDIDCGRIRGFLNTSLAAFDPDERERVLGRATARVLAHELFHVLARTRKHGTWGVAKSCHTAKELLGDTFRFEPKEEELLRRTRIHGHVDSAEPPAMATGQ